VATPVTTVTIHNLKVETQATDTNGVARDLGAALQRSLTAGAANSGLR
jgi:hypothetical protein